MTINIGLVTSDAVVLGCDSIASATSFFLDPSMADRDNNGAFLADGDGKFTLKFTYNDVTSIVTNAWGSVTKIFPIYPEPSPMLAVTAGLAKLNDRPIASIASEFYAIQKQSVTRLDSCKDICDLFLKFFREKYDEEYKISELPPILREGPEFLIGGYGRHDTFASLYRVSVQRNFVHEHFVDGNSGIAWNAQSDAVERFVRGYDTAIKSSLESQIQTQFQDYSNSVKQTIAETVNTLLDTLKQQLPEGWQINLPDPPDIKVNWEPHRVSVDYANLPLQEAIDFVAFLVNLQSGKSRFARGVATVGGRTHIGIVTKDGPKLLNEPELVHRHTGFSHDS
jgi:hypothetical protein